MGHEIFDDMEEFMHRWIDNYDGYDEGLVVAHVTKGFQIDAQLVAAIFNARNRFYRALGLVVPGKIAESRAADDRMIRTDFIHPANLEIDRLTIIDLASYIQFETGMDLRAIILVLEFDARYTMKVTGWEGCEDLIDECGEVSDCLSDVMRAVTSILEDAWRELSIGDGL